MSEKRCPHCGEWSVWTQKLEDPCQHCGKPLGGAELKERKKKIRLALEDQKKWVFYIREEDGPVLRAFKKVANFFYFIFMLIIGFIVWLIAMLPG